MFNNTTRISQKLWRWLKRRLELQVIVSKSFYNFVDVNNLHKPVGRKIVVKNIVTVDWAEPLKRRTKATGQFVQEVICRDVSYWDVIRIRKTSHILMQYLRNCSSEQDWVLVWIRSKKQVYSHYTVDCKKQMLFMTVLLLIIFLSSLLFL